MGLLPRFQVTKKVLRRRLNTSVANLVYLRRGIMPTSLQQFRSVGMGLDAKSYEAYCTNGFVAGIPVFSAQSVAEIRGEIEALEPNIQSQQIPKN